MGLYHYYSHLDMTETCQIHKDLGLLSFIPCSKVPGLQVLDYEIMQWVEVEKFASLDDVIVIGCETLERASGSYYPACIHRVMGTVDRTSIVFKLRGCSNAVIEVSSQIPNVDYLPASLRHSTTIKDFISNSLEDRDSVNFPSQSFNTYRNCILNPSTNLSIKSGKSNEKPSNPESNQYAM